MSCFVVCECVFVVFPGDVDMNGGGTDTEANARLSVYTKGGAGQPAIHIDSGGNGDGLHIETGNNNPLKLIRNH